ncbi:MAG: PDZ domain-containing protein [Akkermansiaceae bacterium]|nr:PDZ domain-containing protein [Akkermansiaceae bacterium]
MIKVNLTGSPSSIIGAYILFQILLIAAGCPRAFAQVSDVASKVDSVELVEAEGLFLVAGVLDSRAGLFMIDTGSGCSVIDPSDLSERHPGAFLANTQINSESSTIVLRKVYSPPFSFAIGSTALPFHVIYSDLREYRELSSQNIIAIVGVSSFRDHALVFDFEKGKLSLARRLEDSSFGTSATYRFRLNYGMPTLRAGFSLCDLDVMVDSGGAFELALPEALFDALVALEELEITGRTTSLISLGNLASEPTGVLRDISVGGRHYPNLRVQRIRSAYPLIGSVFLKRFSKVAFDFPNRRLCVGDTVFKGVSSPKSADRLGLLLSYKGGRRFIAALNSDTPIAKAGILVGDEILEVDRVPVSQGPAINRIITEKGRTLESITFRISRGGRIIEVDVTPRDFMADYLAGAKRAALDRLIESARSESGDGGASWMLHEVARKKSSPVTPLLETGRLLQQSSALDNSIGLWLLGMQYEAEGKQGQAVEFVSKAAAKGYTDAQLKLGAWAAGGTLTGKRDPDLALEWYRKAALGGDPRGALSAADLYNLAGDLGRALGWFRISLELGSKDGEASIAQLESSITEAQKDIATELYKEFFALYAKDPFMKF